MKLSKHFESKDFACPCGECSLDGKQFNLSMLMVLDRVIDQYGRKPKIVKGLVCKDYNLKTKGLEKSYHLLENGGCAIHVKVSNGYERRKLARIAMAQNLTVGVHKDFIHLDGRHYVFRRPNILFPH